MKPLEYPLLLDENIHPEVGKGLRGRGLDVQTVVEVGLGGHPDFRVLEFAVEQGRVVVTHDSDFGTLAVRSGAGLVGIIYLRPGHISATVVLETLDVVGDYEVSVEPPFIIVADRRADAVRVRLRQLG